MGGLKSSVEVRNGVFINVRGINLYVFLDKVLGQNTHAGTNLKHVVISLKRKCVADFLGNVLVFQKMLSEVFFCTYLRHGQCSLMISSSVLKATNFPSKGRLCARRRSASSV